MPFDAPEATTARKHFTFCLYGCVVARAISDYEEEIVTRAERHGLFAIGASRNGLRAFRQMTDFRVRGMPTNVLRSVIVVAHGHLYGISVGHLPVNRKATSVVARRCNPATVPK